MEFRFLLLYYDLLHKLQILLFQAYYGVEQNYRIFYVFLYCIYLEGENVTFFFN